MPGPSHRAIRGAHWAAPLIESLAQSPDDTLAWVAGSTRLVKSDPYSRVGLLELQQQSCLVKLFIAKSSWQKMAYRLGYSRAARSFDAATQLLDHGLPVPAPLACLLVPEGMLLLTEAIAGGEDLRILWRAQPGAELVVQFMQSAADSLAALHRAGFAHGDCKWSNLLWNGQRVFLVDLEAVSKVADCAQGSLSPAPRQLRDLARFTVDAEELAVSQLHYDVFLQNYCASIGGRRELLVPRISSAAEPIRRRHRRKYGIATAALL